MYGTQTEQQAGAGVVVSAAQPLAELGAVSRVDREIQFDPEPAVPELSEDPTTADLVVEISDDHMVVGTQDDSDDGSEREVDPAGDLGSEDVSPDPRHSDSVQDESSATSLPAEASEAPGK